MAGVTRVSRKLILASASPRRRELMKLFGLPFDAVAADIDETVLPGELPAEYVRRMAAGKAHRGLELAGPGPVVLGADTAVVLGPRILGKPRDRADALHILQTLSGQTHEVLSAVAVTDGDTFNERLSVTEVTFGALSIEQCEAYWATGEPADKAGAYGIQGIGGLFVKYISGSYTGVVGLPVYETAELLRCMGYEPGPA